MPCNSDHMNATTIEREVSRIACLLDELAGIKWEKSHWNGYHPSAYGHADRAIADSMTKQLCDALQAVDVAQYGLEMQIWWRDHQAADKARIQRELAQSKTEAERKAALDKLTPHERRVLGLA